MKILVTGGTGVVGAAAVPALLGAGHEVRLLSRHAEDDATRFPAGVEAFTANVTDPAQLAGALHGCDAVLHIAGIVEDKPPEITFENVNVQGTRHLLAAAEETGAPAFVFVSSLGADRGESDYHRSKLQAEELVRDYAGPWVILRPGNVYGPGDETISMLLKMVRTLPAVPMVADGAQPFQPVWYLDLGHAIAQLFGDLARFTGRTLELAGPEVTTTEDIFQRLAAITGKNPPRVAVPTWLTQIGAQAMEAFGGMGQRFLEAAGLSAPISSAKLTMLLEGSVIPERERNALLSEFELTPTGVQEGLEQLATLLPEQLPGDGVGAVTHASYSAEIRGSPWAARDLLDRVCENIAEVMPFEFAAEPGAPRAAREGETLTANLTGRGHIQVRLEERTENRATFVTVESHPLAGVMQLHAEDLSSGIRFNVHTASQAANALDWVAMRALGDRLQAQNWRAVVERVVKLSGGAAPDGVRHTAHAMTETEKRDLRVWLERLVQRQQRTRAEQQMNESSSAR